MDLLMVGIIVLGAIAYIGRRFIRSAKTKSCGGCDGCGCSGTKDLKKEATGMDSSHSGCNCSH